MSVPAALRGVVRRLRGGGAEDRPLPVAQRSAVLEYGRRAFVKSYRREVALEYRRGQALHEAAVAGGSFRAPRPIALVEAADLIVWECLDGLLELRAWLAREVARRPGARAERASLFARVGSALADIHAALRPLGAVHSHEPFEPMRTGDADLDGYVAARLRDSPRGPLHWDFVCGNLFLVERPDAHPELVVLDASPNWYLFPPDGLQTSSPLDVDGAVLAFSLHGHPRFSPLVAPEAAAYLDAFVEGYERRSGYRHDRALLLAGAAEVTRVYRDFVRREEAGSATGSREDRYRTEARDRLLEQARLVAGGAGGRRG